LELIINANPLGRSAAGISYIIFGKIGNVADIDLASFSSSQGFRVLGGVGNSNSGKSVSRAGDVNGDGIADVIIGAPTYNGGTTYNAVIYGRRGISSDIDIASLSSNQGFRILSTAYCGRAVNTAGHVNGDGIDDIILDNYLFSPFNRQYAGISYVIYGKLGGSADINVDSFTAGQGFRVFGSAQSDYSGNSVSTAGDINGDGINDLVIGAYFAYVYGRQQAGISFIIYGKAGGSADIDLASLTSSQGFRIYGASIAAQSGFSVSNAGDINGDGIMDVIIGAVRDSPY